MYMMDWLNKKNSPSFTVFEVLLSLGILVAMVSIVANLELRSLLRVLSDRDELEKIFFIKKDQFIQSLKHHIEQKKYTQKLEEPLMKYTSAVVAINPKSSLASLRHRLFIVHTVGTWKYERAEHEQRVTTFVTKNEPKKDTDKEKK